MKTFILAVLVSAVLGGLAAFGLLDLVREPVELRFGEYRIPVEVREEIYDRGELLIAVGAASLLAAALAYALGVALEPRRKARR